MKCFVFGFTFRTFVPITGQVYRYIKCLVEQYQKAYVLAHVLDRSRKVMKKPDDWDGLELEIRACIS